MKYNFKNDYSVLCNQEILDELTRINSIALDGYGVCDYDDEVREILKKEIDSSDIDIHFMTGGTNVNKLSLMHILRPYEAVISCDTGHIAVHETGAIENSGHKVIITKNVDAKLTVENIDKVYKENTAIGCHMTLPKVVFISDSTEYGSVYTKEELTAISSYCHSHDMYLYLDGARLASALTCVDNDLTLKDINNLCDIFYIGGTKSGAMIGECLIIKNEKLKENFRYTLKMGGGMLAKGFLVSAQFRTLFTDKLFYKNGLHENEMADILRKGFLDSGYKFYLENSTNQVFVEMTKERMLEINKEYDCSIFDELEDKVVVRFVTSFNTPKHVVEEFVKFIKELN